MFREEIIPAGTIYLVNAGNKKYVYILLQGCSENKYIGYI